MSSDEEFSSKSFFKEAATKDFDVSSKTETPKQLCGVQLMEHQKIGLDFLVRMEKTKDKKGGILCDDMGLGKTIQAIALMVSRPSKKIKRGTIKSGKLKSRATLIVAPVAILRQWQFEIEQYTDPQLKVLIFHGSRRPADPEKLLNYDVIITGYSTLRSEMREEERGPLADIYFHRIILDEAHTIKSWKSSTSIACYKLKGKYRWCLTATPVQNSIRDLFALICFLRIEPYCHRQMFEESIGKPLGKCKRQGESVILNERAIKEVQDLIKSISLRRTKQSKVDNKCIVELPKKNIQMVHTELSRYERQIYEYVRQTGLPRTSNRRINLETVSGNDSDDEHHGDSGEADLVDNKVYKKVIKPLKTELRKNLQENQLTNTLKMRLSSPLGIILRLRQACLHPSFLTENPDNAKPYVVRFKIKTAEKKVDEETVEDNTQESAEELWNTARQQRILCHKCNVFKLEPQWVVKCGHMLCHKCFRDVIWTDDLRDKKDVQCPLCHDDVYFALAVPVKDALHEAHTYHRELARKRIAAPPQNASSTKIKAMLDILEKTKQESNNKDKTIIFSQFTKYLDKLHAPLKDAKFKFLQFDGSMSVEKRDKILRKFATDPEVTVLLASTMCASVGLNLVAANRVIMMDVWWNPAVESQAIDRVYRIGQTKEVFVYRIIIKNTVEDSMLDLQLTKQTLIEKALDEKQFEMESLTMLFRKLNMSVK